MFALGLLNRVICGQSRQLLIVQQVGARIANMNHMRIAPLQGKRRKCGGGVSQSLVTGAHAMQPGIE